MTLNPTSKNSQNLAQSGNLSHVVDHSSSNHKITLDHLDRFSAHERTRILHALDLSAKWHAPQRRVSGEPYIIHPVAVAQILIDEFDADVDTVIGGLLHDTVEDTTATPDEIKEKFGEVVAFLVDGATDVGKGDGAVHIEDRTLRDIATHKKIDEYARKDSRLYLIKIADRWHNMKTCHALRSKNQVRLANEAISFHVMHCRELGFVRQADQLELLCKEIIAKFPNERFI